MHIKELRFHHLFCVPLFGGKGYSDDFTENMYSVKNGLLDGKNFIRLVSRCDCLCSHCPNKLEDGCALDSNSVRKISDTDKYISNLLKISEDFETNFYSALKKALYIVNEAEFINICGTCRWHNMGICSFEKWRISAEKIVQP